MASSTQVINFGICGSTWSPAMFSIISIRLNGKNYAPWAKSVEVYFLGKKQLSYLHDDPPDAKDANLLSGVLRMRKFVYSCGIV